MAKTSGGRTVTEILRAAAEIKKHRSVFEESVIGVVMFIDLVGSTNYKTRHPREEDWLPWLAGFLHGASEIVRQRGQVVKYIGDEVMATFLGDGSVLRAEHTAEQILAFAHETDYRVKIAMDYGKLSLLDFSKFQTSGRGDRSRLAKDPQGTTVDRCARIAKRAEPSTALTSAELVNASQAAERWRRCGNIIAKGVGRVPVFQLSFAHSPRLKLSGTSDVAVHKLCKRREERLQRLVKDLKRLRDDRR